MGRAAQSRDVLADKKRAGRPTLGLDTDGAMSVMEKSIREGLAPAQIALRLKSRLNIHAHKETVRRWLKQHLPRPLLQKRKPKLNATSRLIAWLTARNG